MFSLVGCLDQNDTKSETGLELLNRLTSRPTVQGLEPDIFEEKGPLPGDVIEITGIASTGKTSLLTQWVAKCVLPSTWKNIPLGGLGVQAVFINMDQHFCVLHLVTVMEAILNNKNVEEPQDVIQDSLLRLFVFDCYNQMQLHFTMQSVKTHVMAHHRTSVVFIDSINSFYWEDRLVHSSKKSMNSYSHTLLQSVVDVLKPTNVISIYTKLQYTQENCRAHPVPFFPATVDRQIIMKLEHSVFSLLYRTQDNPSGLKKMKCNISKGVIQFS